MRRSPGPPQPPPGAAPLRSRRRSRPGVRAARSRPPARPRGAGGGTVGEAPPVAGPRPAPLRRDPVLLAAGSAPRALVDAVGVDPGVQPGPAGRRAVVLKLLV